MTGLPFAIYPLSQVSPGAFAFLQAYITRATAGPAGYVPERHGWLSTCNCTRCRACGTAVPIGGRAVDAGGHGEPRPRRADPRGAPRPRVDHQVGTR